MGFPLHMVERKSKQKNSNIWGNANNERATEDHFRICRISSDLEYFQGGKIPLKMECTYFSSPRWSGGKWWFLWHSKLNIWGRVMVWRIQSKTEVCLLGKKTNRRRLQSNFRSILKIEVGYNFRVMIQLDPLVMFVTDTSVQRNIIDAMNLARTPVLDQKKIWQTGRSMCPLPVE